MNLRWETRGNVAELANEVMSNTLGVVIYYLLKQEAVLFNPLAFVISPTEIKNTVVPRDI